jgi:hypothetical protein
MITNSVKIIVTGKGFTSLIMMSSIFDDRIYYIIYIIIDSSITITVNYNSSHIALFHNDVCLTNLYEESLTVV